MSVALMAVQHRESNWTAEEDRRLLDLIAAGKSWTLISGTLKRSMKSVKLHVKTLRLVAAKKNEG
jgi:DNA-binding NarL/FixJ family response regulator